MIKDNLYNIIMTYLMDGSAKRGGFLNYYDIGYYVGDTWNSVLVEKLPIKAKRFTSAASPASISFEGDIPPEELLIADYSGKEFYIRVLDTTNDSTALAEVRMAEQVEAYFQTHLSATTEILIQWQISFGS